MKLTTALFCLLASVSQLFADDAMSSAQELVKAVGFSKIAKSQAIQAFQPALLQMQAQGVSEEGLKKAAEAADVFFSNIFEDAQFTNKLSAYLKTQFTDSEMRELATFYRTPVGQKALKALPQTFQQSMAIGENLAQGYSPAFQTKLKNLVETYGKTASASSK